MGRIAVFGDSIAKGIIFDEARGRHALCQHSFLKLIAENTESELDCRARLGWTTEQVAPAIEAYLNAGERPDYIVIEVGGNDSDFDWSFIASAPELDHRPKVALEEYTETLTRLVGEIRAAGVTPVLMNLPPVDANKYFGFFTGGDPEKGRNVLKWLGDVGRIYWWHDRYNQAVEYVAETTATPMINIRRALLKSENYRVFMSRDGIHPNEQGQRQMAAEALDFIRRHCPRLLQRSSDGGAPCKDAHN